MENEMKSVVDTAGTSKQDLKTTVPVYAWVILGVALFAGVAAPLNQFKVPPVMPLLISMDLGV